MKKIMSLLAVMVLMAWTGAASAAMFINLDGVSNNIFNPVTISVNTTDTLYLEVAGTADGGAYDAWSAWSGNAGCDQAQPSMCANGWLWGVGVFFDGDPGSSQGGGVPGIFENPLDALALAKANIPTVVLTGFTTYSFFTGEEILNLDNRGGVSLSYRVVPAVPIPAAAWLFGSALLGLVGVGRRKKA